MSDFNRDGLRIDEYISLIERDLHGVRVKYIGGEFDYFGVEFVIDSIEGGMVSICKDEVKDQACAIVPRSDLEFY